MSFPGTLISYRHFDTDFNFSTKLCFGIYRIKDRKLNLNKYKCLDDYMDDCSIILWMFTNWNSPKKWDTKLSVTHKHDVLSVYCWRVIFFDLLFITLISVYLQTLLHWLIIYSYKTNPSFLPCPWNLRSIGPSDCN